MTNESRDALINKIRDIAGPNAYVNSYTYDQQQMHIKQAIEIAVKNYVNDVVEVLIRDLYTTEDFERDLTLR